MRILYFTDLTGGVWKKLGASVRMLYFTCLAGGLCGRNKELWIFSEEPTFYWFSWWVVWMNLYTFNEDPINLYRFTCWLVWTKFLSFSEEHIFH